MRCFARLVGGWWDVFGHLFLDFGDGRGEMVAHLLYLEWLGEIWMSWFDGGAQDTFACTR